MQIENTEGLEKAVAGVKSRMGSMEKSSGREGVLSPGKMDSLSLWSLKQKAKDPIAVEQVLLLPPDVFQ